MGSPELSCRVVPPGSAGATSWWYRRMFCGRGDTVPALSPASGGLRCRAVLVLAVCLSVTALPHILGSLVALSPGASYKRDSMVALHRDLLGQSRRAQMDAEGTVGCFHGEEDLCNRTDTESLVTPTGALKLELGANSMTASDSPAPSSFSHVQNETVDVAAPTRSPRLEQTSQLESFPESSPVLPTAGASSWDGTHSTVWTPPVTPGGTEAALVVGTIGDEVLGNGSGLTAIISSLPPLHGVSHLRALAPSLPTEGLGGSAVTLEEPSDPSPAHQAGPALTKAPSVPVWMWFPSTTGPTEDGESLISPATTLEPGATETVCQHGAAVGASWCPKAADVSQGSPVGLTTQTSSPAASSEHTLGSVHPPSSKPSAAGPCISSPSPTYLPASITTTHAPSSQTFTASTLPTSAHPKSSPSPATSQHPSADRADVPVATSWVAAGEFFTPEQLATTVGSAGSMGTKTPVHTLPLSFRLLGIAFTEDLSKKFSRSYKELEKEVRMMLHQVLSTYDTFLQANILGFKNGSVLVQAQAVFQGEAPTSSHLIRTLVAGASWGHDAFSWWLEPHSISSNGFNVESLDPEKLSISFTVLGGMEPAERLVGEVMQSLSALYPVRNVTVGQLRKANGDLEMAGDVYLDTTTHANITAVLQALTALATCSVDLSSLSVQGTRLQLQVYPLSFLVTNWHFSKELLDPLTSEHRELRKALGNVVAKALRDNGSFLQVVIRGFLPGSLLCHGDAVFQLPAPSSLEVLEALVLAVGPDKALAASDFQVDPYSISVGEDTLEPPPAPGFPEYGVSIIVVCGLIIITIPIVLLVCLRTRRFGWSDVAVLSDRRDPEAGTQTLEMENRGFWAASDEATEEAHECWQRESVAC
ncbi:taste receptor cell protein 1-like [Tympanuchus pallidicinctus]|uniref:taste receptor cell protein 1-like n=1 Tax=Tympanuchus pallidicinctus TaxID=109042 RepID=UPI002286E060|nr:taste receptor cell protein 1-like [Tympanuchus pallidicinctus]